MKTLSLQRLFVLVSVVFCVISARSQWVQTPYNFYQTPGENSNGYTRYEDGAHVNIGKIISCASNGYGTWAVDDAGHWFLIGNHLKNEVNIVGSLMPSGIIAQGTLPASVLQDTTAFSYHSNEMKVVCNAYGSVRFVAPGHGPGGSRTVFVVFGFDEAPEVPAEHKLDLNFNGLPKTLPANDVEQSLVFIKDQISTNSTTINTYPVIQTRDTSGAQHPIFDGEGDYRDAFDIAMDGSFLYTAWTWNELQQGGTFLKRVLATVTSLQTGMVHDSTIWPTLFGQQNSYNGPTVACDIRRKPNAPIFELAHMGLGTGLVVVKLRTYNGGWSFVDLSPISTYYPGSIIDTATFQRCRVVVGSAFGATAPRKVVYAIGHAEGARGALFINDRLHENPAANPWWNRARELQNDHVPNNKQNYRFRISAQHSPVKDTDDYRIANVPIIAFANPYDGESDSDYNEFHCVYQLYPSDGLDTLRPLVICRTSDNGVWTSSDSRTVVSRKFDTTWTFTALPDLGAFAASVNQSGIHVFWKDKNSNKILYNRDQRKFDEGIEENTVVTYNQPVASNPQDSSPARILPGRKVVLWTDPHFGVTDTTQGLYVRNELPYNFPDFNSAGFVFPSSSGAEFHVGNDNSTDDGATLIAFPNTYIQFAATEQDPPQVFVVNQASTLDWYGTVNSTLGSAEIQPNNSNTYGLGTIRFLGDSAVMTGGSHGRPSSLIRPATLTVHGGSILGIGEGVIFESINSLLNFRYEKHIEPVFGTDTSANTITTGQLLVRGKAELTNSIIIGNNTNGSFNFPAPIITIRPAMSAFYDDHFITTNCSFTNSGSNRSQIVFEGDLGVIDTTAQHYRNVLISGGRFAQFEILAFDPVDLFDFTIEYASFDNLRKKAIHFKRTEGLNYDHINVRDNVFYNTSLSNSDWITFDGFDMNHVYHTEHVSDAQVTYYVPHSRILILGNLMETPASHTGIVGIRLANSAAGVAYNHITGDDYKYGIWQELVGLATGDRRSSFFCSNEIANCNEGGNGAGIRTENWFGFSKMNDISNSDVGHLSGNRDQGFIVFSDIHYNLGAGLRFLETQVENQIDLRGVIPVGPYYTGVPYAAKNTFDSNNTAGTTGQIEVSNSSDLLMGDWDNTLETSSTSHSDNNIIRTGTTDDFIYYSGSDTIDIVNIDSNYWENGNSTVFIPPATATDPPFDNVIYSSAATSAFVKFTVSGVVCSSGIPSNEGKAEDKGQHPMSAPLADTSCLSFKLGAGTRVNQGRYQEAYEMYQRYFELCAVEESTSWKEFNGIGAANGSRSNDNARFEEFRAWLKKVLYYILDTSYYCADAAEIIGTFQWFDSARGHDHLGAIAVAKYLYESGKCSRPQDSAYLVEGIEEEWVLHANRWQDTVKDPSATPLDSTLPTLEDLDLTILYGPSEVVTDRENRIGVITAVRNPFTNFLELRYRLDRSAMTRIEICDVLGKSVYSEGQGFKEEGDHTVTLSSKDWPSGSYYVRLSTPSGEVKTVKVIKE